jgi:hypothetical protein
MIFCNECREHLGFPADSTKHKKGCSRAPKVVQVTEEQTNQSEPKKTGRKAKETA